MKNKKPRVELDRWVIILGGLAIGLLLSRVLMIALGVLK